MGADESGGQSEATRLDLAARIVAKHGGNIWVESQPGDTC